MSRPSVGSANKRHGGRGILDPGLWHFRKQPVKRPLLRVLPRLIEDPLSKTLLTTKFSAGDSVLVELVDKQIKLTPIQKRRGPKAEKPEKPEKPPVEPLAGKGKGEAKAISEVRTPGALGGLPRLHKVSTGS